MELYSIFMAGMGEATAVCHSVNLFLCALISIFCNVTRNLVQTVPAKVFQLFVLRIYAFCMALVVVEPVQDSVCDPFVLKRNGESLVMGCWFSTPAKKLENIFGYTEHHSDPGWMTCYE